MVMAAEGMISPGCIRQLALNHGMNVTEDFISNPTKVWLGKLGVYM